VDVSVLWCASSSYGSVSVHVRGVSVVLCVSRYSRVTIFYATDKCVLVIVNYRRLGLFSMFI
jgi:hypothetical protein